MESLLTCEICMEIFDEKKRIPKVLKCGHTLCSRCLPNIGGCCPSCRQEVPTTDEEVLTNFSLLSLLGKKETSLHSNKIQNHAEDLVKLLSKKKVIEKEIEEKRLLKEAIENEVEKIRQIVSAEGCSSSIRDEEDLKNEEREPKAGAHEPKPRQDPNCLLLESFGSTTEFLSHVKRLLLQERKKVFACHQVRGHLKYGEVFYKEELVLSRERWSRKDLLVMKSLSESQAEESAAVVRFSDIQKCFTAHNFLIHFVFRDKNYKGTFAFNFRPVESRILPQLIQLCTGEKEPTYKGAKVSVIEKGEDDYEVGLLNYVVDGVETRGAVGPLASVRSRRRMHEADVSEEVYTYVEVNEEGQLRIFHGLSNKANEARNSDGVVFYSRCYFGSSFWGEFEDVVVDCGVAIQL